MRKHLSHVREVFGDDLIGHFMATKVEFVVLDERVAENTLTSIVQPSQVV